jgi:4a-hydroxytetrahydrobiopterin dehydratase
MAGTLTLAERDALAVTLPNWTVTTGGDAVRRSFRFRDFSEAWAFMSRVALLAERHDHHPSWSNAANMVEIALSSRDAGGLTGKDVSLARAIDLLLP